MRKDKNSLSIIMYHYVQKKNNFNKGLKFLNYKHFIGQLDYLKKKYIILSPDEAKKALLEKKSFQKKFCWLTFDDGYKEHYNIVFPELEKRNIKASFFPTIKPITQNIILEVNKIQLILGRIDKTTILREIKNYYNNKLKYKISFEDYASKIKLSNQFDDKQTTLIKQLLQKIIPEKHRFNLNNFLLDKYFKQNQIEISKKMYLNKKDLIEMSNSGHEIGIHSYDHPHFDYLNEKKQRLQISKSISFLKKNNLPTQNLTINYPYGAHNKITDRILKKIDNIKFGLTIKSKVIYTKKNDLMYLPRIDTVDLLKKNENKK